MEETAQSKEILTCTDTSTGRQEDSSKDSPDSQGALTVRENQDPTLNNELQESYSEETAHESNTKTMDSGTKADVHHEHRVVEKKQYSAPTKQFTVEDSSVDIKQSDDANLREGSFIDHSTCTQRPVGNSFSDLGQGTHRNLTGLVSKAMSMALMKQVNVDLPEYWPVGNNNKITDTAVEVGIDKKNKHVQTQTDSDEDFSTKGEKTFEIVNPPTEDGKSVQMFEDQSMRTSLAIVEGNGNLHSMETRSDTLYGREKENGHFYGHGILQRQTSLSSSLDKTESGQCAHCGGSPRPSGVRRAHSRYHVSFSIDSETNGSDDSGPARSSTITGNQLYPIADDIAVGSADDHTNDPEGTRHYVNGSAVIVSERVNCDRERFMEERKNKADHWLLYKDCICVTLLGSLLTPLTALCAIRYAVKSRIARKQGDYRSAAHNNRKALLLTGFGIVMMIVATGCVLYYCYYINKPE